MIKILMTSFLNGPLFIIECCIILFRVSASVIREDIEVVIYEAITFHCDSSPGFRNHDGTKLVHVLNSFHGRNVEKTASENLRILFYRYCLL